MAAQDGPSSTRVAHCRAIECEGPELVGPLRCALPDLLRRRWIQARPAISLGVNGLECRCAVETIHRMALHFLAHQGRGLARPENLSRRTAPAFAHAVDRVAGNAIEHRRHVSRRLPGVGSPVDARRAWRAHVKPPACGPAQSLAKEQRRTREAGHNCVRAAPPLRAHGTTAVVGNREAALMLANYLNMHRMST